MRIKFLLLFVLIGLQACRENVVSTTHESASRTQTNQRGLDDGGPRGIEAIFHEVTREIPGFAGFYFNERKEFVIQLTDVSHGARAIALLRSFASRTGSRGGTGNPTMVIQQAKYDFAQLSNWRDLMIPLLDTSGVVSLDADESTNAVQLGVATTDLFARIISQTRALGIPDEAVRIVRVEPLVQTSTSTSSSTKLRTASLRDSIRPVPGGMQWQASLGQTGYQTTCTIGVNAKWGPSQTNGFLTASHCTLVQGGAGDSTLASQPRSFSDTIAKELLDPAYWTSGPYCTPGRNCRYSDAAFLVYRDTMQFAAIAQPTAECTAICGDTINNLSRLNISLINPRFWIIEKDVSLATYGQEVQHVGRTSGWTSGSILGTCAHINVNSANLANVRLLCQTGVSGTAFAGDSGGPVFRFVEGAGVNDVAFMGITVVSGCADYYACTPNYWYFTPIDNIEFEMGTFTIN